MTKNNNNISKATIRKIEALGLRTDGPLVLKGNAPDINATATCRNTGVALARAAVSARLRRQLAK